MTSCWLARFAPAGSTCDLGAIGHLQKCHLVPKQRLKNAGLHDMDILWDPRCWVWACERHHRQLDESKLIRLSLADYPRAFLDFASDHQLYFASERDGWRVEHPSRRAA